MADDLKMMTKDVPQPSIQPQNTKKKTKTDQKKKPEAIDKEVWNITGGLYPMKPQFSNQSNSLTIEQRRQDLQIEPSSKWVYVPINQGNKNLGKIYHWIQEANKDKIYALEKFNIKCDLVQFSDEEYETHLKDLAYDWNLEETRYLWELVHRYDQRWIVIQDAYKYDNRSIEDLKKRYYEVTKKMVQVRDEKNHPVYNYEYNANYEKIRKFELEKYMIRNKEQNEEEKRIMEELKLIQNLIKKEEREEQTVKRILQQEAEDPDFQDEDDEGVFKQYQEEMRRRKQMKTKKLFLRGRWIEEPLPLPAKFNKRLKVLMEELNVPSKILPTEKNEKLYDDLRENILKIFTVSKFIQRKELEKKRLEERLQILKQQEIQKQQQAQNLAQQNQQNLQNQGGQNNIPANQNTQGGPTPQGNQQNIPNQQGPPNSHPQQNMGPKQNPQGPMQQQGSSNGPINNQHPNNPQMNQNSQGGNMGHHGNNMNGPQNYNNQQSHGHGQGDHMNMNQKRPMPQQYQMDGPQDMRKMHRPNPPNQMGGNPEYRGQGGQYNNMRPNQNYNMNQQGGNYNQNQQMGNPHQQGGHGQGPMYNKQQQYRNEGQYNQQNMHHMGGNNKGGGMQ